MPGRPGAKPAEYREMSVVTAAEARGSDMVLVWEGTQPPGKVPLT